MTDELLDERIRAALPLDDDSDWRDVRRRARRKAAPAALAVTAVVTALIAAPAVAFRHQIADLWATAKPDRNLYVRSFARCGEGSFTLEFHPERGAVVRQRGQTLAQASVSDRRIECNARIQSFKGTPDESPYYGELAGPRSESVTITCRTNALLEVAVNPIWYGSDITGSAIVVAERQTKRAIASASFKRDPWAGASGRTPTGTRRAAPPRSSPSPQRGHRSAEEHDRHAAPPTLRAEGLVAEPLVQPPRVLVPLVDTDLDDRRPSRILRDQPLCLTHERGADPQSLERRKDAECPQVHDALVRLLAEVDSEPADRPPVREGEQEDDLPGPLVQYLADVNGVERPLAVPLEVVEVAVLVQTDRDLERDGEVRQL